jgi:hypothetical protein
MWRVDRATIDGAGADVGGSARGHYPQKPFAIEKLALQMDSVRGTPPRSNCQLNFGLVSWGNVISSSFKSAKVAEGQLSSMLRLAAYSLSETHHPCTTQTQSHDRRHSQITEHE